VLELLDDPLGDLVEHDRRCAGRAARAVRHWAITSFSGLLPRCASHAVIFPAFVN
jgi:hypothetical protein